MTDKRIVLTTAGSQEEAAKIAHALVERRLAACVNIVPKIASVYRWQGTIESASEVLLLIKTSVRHSEEVRSTIASLHTYEIPEFLVVSVSGGSDTYLAWLEASLR